VHEAPRPSDDPARAARTARTAGALGNAVEWYDFAVLGASATLVAAALTSGGALTAVLAVFSLSFLLRPLGAALGAIWADRIGRRPLLIATVVAMTCATGGIGLLPSWRTSAAVAVTGLLVLRAVQGVATGAELVVSVTYLAEHAPPGRRGLWGGAHLATMACGFAAGVTAVLVVEAALPPTSAATWGWRVPFLAAVPLGLVTLLLRRRALETPDFLVGSCRNVDRSAKGLFTVVREDRSAVLRGFLLTAALMSSVNLWFVYLPARLASAKAMDLGPALASTVLGLLALAVSAVLCGRGSDRWGRRPFLGAAVSTLFVLWTVGYPLVAHDLGALVAVDLAAGVAMGALVVQSAVPESFPVHRRTAGLTFTVGLASAVVGGTSPLLAQALGDISPVLVQLYALVWVAGAAAATLTLPLPRKDEAPWGAVAGSAAALGPDG
jgi:MFS transporter, MHS family, proline/betaine transporter